ncbi:hypothetical protein ACWDUL_05300 [Nocardia niigatensis]|uniref:DUF308 domain-containing protein n=1 Tax=Nocardia niigatensis TaxID=209249 RepID=UPI000300E176|nr:DUF308 domain-containing protein [Nocardia niigatensis]
MPNQPQYFDNPGDAGQTSRVDRFPDSARTTRSHAGESMVDPRNWPGLIVFALGIVALVATLTAAGYGFGGWAIVAGVICVVCLAVGAALVVIEHGRVKHREGRKLGDPGGH